MGCSPEVTYDNVKKYLLEVKDQLAKENININLRPEVMGKVSQFGTLDELLNLAAETGGPAPCIDFAHWRARTGKTIPTKILRYTVKRLRNGWGKVCWEICTSTRQASAFGDKGELHHLNLEEWILNMKSCSGR